MALISKQKAREETMTWEDLPSPDAAISAILRRGVFMDITGQEGTGKSSLALTVARFGKLAYVDIDQSVDRAKKPDSKKERDNVKTLPVRYPLAVGMGEAEIKGVCAPVWATMQKRLVEATGDWARAAVIDTGTELWELNRYAAAGSLNPRGKRMDRVYGPINARIRQMLRQVYRTDRKHLVTVHHLKDEYVDKLRDGELTSVKTGRLLRAGFKEIGYLADVVVRCWKNDQREFRATIELCKLPPLGPSIEGMELEGEQIDFLYVVSLATGTEPGDWT